MVVKAIVGIVRNFIHHSKLAEGERWIILTLALLTSAPLLCQVEPSDEVEQTNPRSTSPLPKQDYGRLVSCIPKTNLTACASPGSDFAHVRFRMPSSLLLVCMDARVIKMVTALTMNGRL
jgi:hypothetical protein